MVTNTTMLIISCCTVVLDDLFTAKSSLFYIKIQTLIFMSDVIVTLLKMKVLKMEIT